jgi:hypothetical protein
LAVTLRGRAAAPTTIGLLATLNGTQDPLVSAQQNVTIPTGQTSAQFLVVVQAEDPGPADGAVIYAILGAENVSATLHTR